MQETLAEKFLKLKGFDIEDFSSISERMFFEGDKMVWEISLVPKKSVETIECNFTIKKP